jgi:hypothetical protein
VLRGDPVKQVQALKNQEGKDIVLTGSISLAHTMIGAGVVAAVRVTVGSRDHRRGVCEPTRMGIQKPC